MLNCVQVVFYKKRKKSKNRTKTSRQNLIIGFIEKKISKQKGQKKKTRSLEF